MHHDFHHAAYLPVRGATLLGTAAWALMAVSVYVLPGLAYDEEPLPSATYLSVQLLAALVGVFFIGLPFRWTNRRPLFAFRLVVILALAAVAVLGSSARAIATNGIRALPGFVITTFYFVGAVWCATESRRRSGTPAPVVARSGA